MYNNSVVTIEILHFFRSNSHSPSVRIVTYDKEIRSENWFLLRLLIYTGIHAREWITPASVLFVLTELLTNPDENIRYIAENYDWYFFPSINPDGYEYSHTKVTTTTSIYKF